ncbi:hypothetical protein G6011_07052 [Alternaria panax]|uniref:Uncharacterized protein n=1 Tax=Alternaria panax TaxID=48097 RepID=A0AAD4F9X3_9PLEO|nr:hypothetical protein G6011_07052 [Alternaria panax]
MSGDASKYDAMKEAIREASSEVPLDEEAVERRLKELELFRSRKKAREMAEENYVFSSSFSHFDDNASAPFDNVSNRYDNQGIYTLQQHFQSDHNHLFFPPFSSPFDTAATANETSPALFSAAVSATPAQSEATTDTSAAAKTMSRMQATAIEKLRLNLKAKMNERTDRRTPGSWSWRGRGNNGRGRRRGKGRGSENDGSVDGGSGSGDKDGDGDVDRTCV